jgi:UDP-glucose 4-epimerase
MKALCVGGAGFVGSHLVERIIQEGGFPVVLDNLSTGKLANLEYISNKYNKNIVFYQGDIKCENKIKETLREEIDTIFHLAAMTSIDKSWNHPNEMSDVNITGTINLLKLAREAGVKKFIFVSSAAVYGKDTREPLESKESDLTFPKSPYAISKLAGELFVKNFQTEKFRVFIARPFNIYGPRQDLDNPYSSVIPKFIKASFNKKPCIIHGDGMQSRDFIYVSDVAKCLAEISRIETKPGDLTKPNTFNIGTGQRTTISFVYNLIKEITESIKEPIFEDCVPGKVRHSFAHNLRIRKILGKDFDFISLPDGLYQMVEYIQSLNA